MKKPVVAMLVDNPVYGDARVVKTARTVGDLGFDVKVIGVDRASPWVETDVPDLDIELVRVRSRSSKRQNPRRGNRLGYKNRRVQAREARRLTRLSLEAQTQAALHEGWLHSQGDRIRGVEISARWSVYRFRKSQLNRAVAREQQLTQQWLADVPNRNPAELVADDQIWRDRFPWPLDFEVALAPVLDSIQPDIIHAHDVRSIGVAVRSAARSRLDGRDVKVIYDAHELVGGVGLPGTVDQGRLLHEAAHIRMADAVVTVSPPLAELLVQNYGLERLPAVTLNAPDREALQGDSDFTDDVRADCGLDANVPLLVYSGVVAPTRGLHTAVAALPELPGVHLAAIVNKQMETRQALQQLAESHGVTDRFHILDFVPRNCIIQHLRSADVAIFPGLHTDSHEIAMPNKFFDYVQAGLPMVVSDLEHLSRTVNEQHLGTVHAAGDPDSFAVATRELLGDLDSYRRSLVASSAWTTGTWDAQRPVLDALYQDLT